MKDETKIWMKYADENLKSARLLLDGSLFNACLQNIQQSVEKSLKALLVEFSIKLIKTHSIGKLTAALAEHDPEKLKPVFGKRSCSNKESRPWSDST